MPFPTSPHLFGPFDPSPFPGSLLFPTAFFSLLFLPFLSHFSAGPDFFSYFFLIWCSSCSVFLLDDSVCRPHVGCPRFFPSPVFTWEAGKDLILLGEQRRPREASTHQPVFPGPRGDSKGRLNASNTEKLDSQVHVCTLRSTITDHCSLGSN